MEDTTIAMKIAPGNEDQARAWDGHEGDMWTEHADRYDRSGRLIWQAFDQHSPVGAADTVLDIGCGTGKATRDAACRTSGDVLGVDLSARQLDLARARSAAEGLTNVRFEQADAQVYPFAPDSFDVAISSYGAMFFADHAAAFANIGAALRPGGRLWLLAWRELARNDWLVLLRTELAFGRDLPVPPSKGQSPFGLADADHVRGLLAGAGFADAAFTPIDQPIDFGPDVDDAMAFVHTMGPVEGLTNGIDSAEAAAALDRISERLSSYATADGVLLPSSSWLITATRS